MSTTQKQPEILKWASKDGEFRRQQSSFRDAISREPNAKFAPESKDRYHLYVSYACPWAHRTLIVRAMKNLESVIGVSVVDYLLEENGWKFSDPSETPGATLDSVNGAQYIRDIYFKADPTYNGRFTVPVLWDKKLGTIVNNESSEIILDELASEKSTIDLYPKELQAQIDDINTWVYDTVNNGVYKSGFATTQQAYENNCVPLFDSLDRIEGILAKNEFLLGSQLTEADIRLWTTIIRFDPVYHGHFKCNVKSIEKDYPHILRWARQIYQLPKVADTVNMDHIKRHYYMSHRQINPTGVVPLGNGPGKLSVPINKHI
ncbi:hypothetical protein BDF22DRAFT_698380 [Syncephalis plumigaleata]|nr:hypothetical protein BDF22DRAFT_698380 [Syncephalis plumigaleata]